MNGAGVTQTGARNIGELKTGIKGQLSKNVNLWGNVAQQLGDKGYSDTSAMLGLSDTQCEFLLVHVSMLFRTGYSIKNRINAAF